MSYFDDASLVMIPSGYKTSKVYSVKPTDGSGDLTFSRSNDTATRVNSAGLIEKVRTNTLTQSGTFSNAAWTKGNLTLTAGQTDPNGGTNAFLATSTGTSAVWFYQSNTGAKTFSIYAKAGTKNFFSIINGTYNNGAGFNLSDQTVTSIGAGSLAKIQSVGGGWYRCSVYVSSALEMLVMLADTSGGSMIIGDTMTFAFAQAETGDIATDYIPTTSAAVSVGPVANVPRLDYLNSSCPRLLLEPQRTNALTYSEDFSNAAYTKGQSSITSNAAIAPDGTMSADKLVEDTSNNPHVIYRSPSGTGDTLSFFAKAAERNWVGVLSNNGNISFFNIANGTLGTIAASSTATITPYGNGWYRCTLYNTHGSFGMSIYLATANGTDTYTGDGTSGAFIWGAQLEESATYATSYIPTLGASVTRGADECSKTGISSLIGQTSGTVFLDFTIDTISGQTNDPVLWYMKDGGTGERYVELYGNGNLLYLEFNGATIATITKTGLTVGRHKCAVAYANNDMTFYVDGVQIGTDTSGTPSAFSTFAFQYYNSPYNGQQKVNQALLFKTRLTNAQLAELTTL